MPTPFHAELTLPNRPASLRIARSCLQELMRVACLPEADSERFLTAAHEACANVIDHAFEPGEEGTFTVIGELSANELTVAIQDTGSPFAPATLADAVVPSDRPARLSAHGGLRLIQEAVDKAYWINRGRQGKELRLIKTLPQRGITEHLPEEQLTPLHEDAPTAPEQEYRIMRFEADHAVGIARCIYRVYGNTYLHDACYYPEKIIGMNQSGELVSIVALDTQGEVVGHYALERPGSTPVAERGIAVVSPTHRGRGLMEKMRVLLEAEAVQVGLAGVYSQAVTLHTRSQRVNEDFGSKVCGITLASAPGEIKFKQLSAGTLPQRISCVLYFTYVVPPTPTVVHAPAHHKAMIERIYNNLNAPFTFGEPQPLEGCGHLSVTYNASAKSGTIQVDRIGVDTPAEIRRACEDLCRVAGVDVVYLNLPLSQPETPELCEAAEVAGFCFSGVGPYFAPQGDALIMQYLNVPLDFSLIQVANPFGQELLAYVEREHTRVHQDRSTNLHS